MRGGGWCGALEERSAAAAVCGRLRAAPELRRRGGGNGSPRVPSSRAVLASPLPSSPLPSSTLIQYVLEDLRAEDNATAAEKRWALVLGPGTWPEVLRRLVLTRDIDDEFPEL